MAYDFTSRASRRGLGSYKWDAMLLHNPDVPEDVIPLSVADMELPCPPEVLAALHGLIDEGPLGYTGPTDAFYDACLGWQRRMHGWVPERDWISLSPGVVPAFHAAVRALTQPGDGVIIQPPVYYPFRAAIEENGRRIANNQLVLDGTRYRMDYEGLERLASDPANKVLLLCSPHNPVGRVWEEDELRRMADICLGHDVFIVSDEIHDDLVMPGHEHVTLARILSPNELGRCMVLTAPSKTFNIAGVQGSVIYVPNGEVRAAFEGEFRKLGMTTGLNIFAYRATEAAYMGCADWLEELISLIWQNYGLLRSTIEGSLPGVRVMPLEGTYLMWADFGTWGLTAPELEEFMRDEALLFLDEGYVFGPGGECFERFNLACPTADIERAGARLVGAARTRGLA